MDDLVASLRTTAPSSAAVLELLAVPRSFSRDEASRVIETGLRLNGATGAILDTMQRTGVLRDGRNQLFVVQSIRASVLKSTPPRALGALARMWVPLLREREVEPRNTAELAHAELLSASMEGALSMRSEFAKAESVAAGERQAFLATLAVEAEPQFDLLDAESQAAMFYLLGMSRYRFGHREQAMGYFKKAIDVGARTMDVAVCSHLYANDLAGRRVQWDIAVSLFQDSISIGEAFQKWTHLSQVHHSFGNMLVRRQQTRRDAERHYLRSLRYAERSHQSDQYAQVQHSYGAFLVRYQRNRWREAEERLMASWDGLEARSHRCQVGHTLGNLLARQQPRWSEAVAWFERSIELAGGDRERSMVLHSFGLDFDSL
jgi:tetratricopeptide (TPR) repeat protein